MLRISFANQSDQRVIQALRTKGPRIVQVIMTKLNQLMFQLQSYIQTDKLRGQALQYRTGKLFGSIRAIPSELVGKTVVAGVEGAGGPAWYGRLFEDEEAGGEGGVPHSWTITATRARALAFVMGGRQVFVRSVVHPAMAARPFMTPALEENAAAIEAELRAAVDIAVETDDTEIGAT